MLVLFDNGTPRTLARYLIDHHAVTEARARGWDELENGELLNAAEAAGFDVPGDDGQKSELSAKSLGQKNRVYNVRRVYCSLQRASYGIQCIHVRGEAHGCL